jgi:FkbM family methyltransferase
MTSLIQYLRSTVNRALEPFGVRLESRRAVRDPVRLLCLKMAELGVETVLDVGANVGQFAGELRREGWQGRVVSFEPVPVAHAELERRAKADPHWIVAPPMALGRQSASLAMNVSRNLVSSSLLSVEQRATDAAPEAAHAGVETIRVEPLDAVLASDWPAPFAVKLDTQGFELEVLAGAEETMKQAKVVMTELSLTRLYRDGAKLTDVYAWLEDAGFECIALTEGFLDLAKNEMLQVDGVFVRR